MGARQPKAADETAGFVALSKKGDRTVMKFFETRAEAEAYAREKAKKRRTIYLFPASRIAGTDAKGGGPSGEPSGTTA